MKKIKLKKFSKKQKILLVLILLAIIAIVFAVVRSFMVTPQTEDYTEEQPVYEKAQRMDVENSISAKGEIVSGLEEDLTPHAGYKLKEVKVKENEEIKEGGVILTYTNGKTMTAPYKCVVKKWNLPKEKNEITNSHSVSISSTSVLNIKLSVSEEEILKIKKGYTATVKVKATGKSYKGYVCFVSDVGNYSDGSSEFDVNVSFDNDGKIKLGMNGKAKISLGKASNVIAVPVDAVYTDGDSSYVTKKLKGKDSDGNDKTEDVKVKTGLEGRNYIEIKSGLKEGDKVLVNSSDDEGSVY